MKASDTIESNRAGFRVGILLLAAPFVGIGAWALATPRGWYDDFPGGGHHWIRALGAYDEHLVRDFASLYLGLGLLLVLAAILLSRPLVQGALGALLVFEVPHFIFHAANTEPLSTGDNVANLLTLGVGLVVTAALLALTFRSPRAASQPAAESPRAASQTSAEGGLRYGKG
jgi:hypothetical protein